MWGLKKKKTNNLLFDLCQNGIAASPYCLLLKKLMYLFQYIHGCFARINWNCSLLIEFRKTRRRSLPILTEKYASFSLSGWNMIKTSSRLPDTYVKLLISTMALTRFPLKKWGLCGWIVESNPQPLHRLAFNISVSDLYDSVLIVSLSLFQTVPLFMLQAPPAFIFQTYDIHKSNAAKKIIYTITMHRKLRFDS